MSWEWLLAVPGSAGTGKLLSQPPFVGHCVCVLFELMVGHLAFLPADAVGCFGQASEWQSGQCRVTARSCLCPEGPGKVVGPEPAKLLVGD